MTEDGAKPTTAAANLAATAAERYGDELLRYLMRRLRNDQDAKDLSQEVYLRLLRVGDAERVRDYKAYLHRIASHVVYEFRMRQKQSRVTFDSDALDAMTELPPPSAANSDRLADELGARQDLMRVLAQLPSPCRSVFLLHKHQGMTYEEIAGKLGMSVH